MIKADQAKAKMKGFIRLYPQFPFFCGQGFGLKLLLNALKLIRRKASRGG